MAGYIDDKDYFENEVQPHIDNKQIIYEGNVSDERKKGVTFKRIRSTAPD